MMIYNPFNWYWLASDGRLFSSARQAIVPTTDSTYTAWVAAGNVASAWPKDNAGAQSNAALQAILTPFGLFATLAAYAQAKQAKIAAGGISVTVATGVSIEAATDTASLILLQGAATMAQQNASATFNWVQSTGVAVTLTAAQVTTVFNAVTSFIQSTFSALASVISQINASTITTTAQVDAASWPVNS